MHGKLNRRGVWKEAAWENRRRRRGRAVNAGDRMVVAEVIRDYKDGWVELLVRGSTVVFEKPGWLLKPLLANVTVKRRRRTIERGIPSLPRGRHCGATDCSGIANRLKRPQ